MENSLRKRFIKPWNSWIKATIWCLLYILFIVWVGNYWWLLLLPIILDVFITKFIPWSFWKKTKNKVLYTICSWIDAIIFALVAVYFINLFLFQNYQIPTSSLEKSLLVGDFLFVSKASYGPRIPNTPLSFPLVQHTLPIVNCKSYIENPQWEYRRLKGWDKVETNDIVVFNFPAGDTVALNMQNPDYYSLCHRFGRENVWGRPDIFGEIVYRPVDRRENYVKRCVGIAGDSLQIINNVIYVNGKAEKFHEGVQLNYYVQTDGTNISDQLYESLNVSKDDRKFIPANNINPQAAAVLKLDPNKGTYHFPLTQASAELLKKQTYITTLVIEPDWQGGEVYPLGNNYGWTRDNYGPIYIPKRGDVIDLTLENLSMYEPIITNYEHNTLQIKDSTIYINHQPATSYQVKMNYYWMMGDNRHNSADSRYWGYVPEDHIVGRPVAVWLSLDKDKGWFSGKIRWNRFFKDASK